MVAAKWAIDVINNQSLPHELSIGEYHCTAAGRAASTDLNRVVRRHKSLHASEIPDNRWEICLLTPIFPLLYSVVFRPADPRHVQQRGARAEAAVRAHPAGAGGAAAGTEA